jgi:hypothetical protein
MKQDGKDYILSSFIFNSLHLLLERVILKQARNIGRIRNKKCIHNFGKLNSKRRVGRRISRYKGNIKMNLRERDCEGGN